MKSVLTAHLYHRDSRQVQVLDAQGVLDSRPVSAAPEPINGKAEKAKGAFRGTQAGCRAGELMWIDVSAPSGEDFALLTGRFGLHPMVLEDLKSHEGRPKLHDYADYLYLIFHALRYEIEDDEQPSSEVPPADRFGNRYALKIDEIDCLVGSDYVITLHEEPLQPLEDLKKRWNRTPDLMRAGASYLLYEIIDEVLDDYFPLLDLVDERVDDIEARLFLSSDTGQSDQKGASADIFAVKRTLVQVRRIAGPMRDVVNILLRRDAEAGGKHFAYYQDLYDHAVRIVDMTDTFRDILSGLLDSYLAMASNRMNEVMKTLTSASIMLLVPGLMAGIYGMNFENMPELHTRYGYFVVLGLMATTVGGLYAAFRKKGWL